MIGGVCLFKSASMLPSVGPLSFIGITDVKCLNLILRGREALIPHPLRQLAMHVSVPSEAQILLHDHEDSKRALNSMKARFSTCLLTMRIMLLPLLKSDIAERCRSGEIRRYR